MEANEYIYSLREKVGLGIFGASSGTPETLLKQSIAGLETVQKVQMLTLAYKCTQDPLLELIVSHFESSEEDVWVVSAGEIASAIGRWRWEVRRVFSMLEGFGQGRLILGRRGYKTRFDSKSRIKELAAAIREASVELAAAIRDESLELEVSNNDDSLVENEEARDDGERDISQPRISHRFVLRPDFVVKIDLPQDLSSIEADRLSGFLKSVPFS